MPRKKKNETQITEIEYDEQRFECPVNEKKLLEYYYSHDGISSALIQRKFRCSYQNAVKTIAWLMLYHKGIPTSVFHTT